jgi:hypothetical protein
VRVVDNRSIPEPWYGPRSGDSELTQTPRRLLLVSYHFPPDNAVGGLRWQQFSRYFAARGWGVDVISRDVTRLKTRDEGRLKLLPADCRIYGASEPQPFLARVEQIAWKVVRRLAPRRKARSAVALKQHEVGKPSHRQIVRAYNAWMRVQSEKMWGREVTRIGIDLAGARSYDAVASSGPPHMSHEAARQIAKATGIPLVIDLRDPWSAVEQVPEDHASPVWFALARRFERLAVRDASLVVMNTDMARDEMRARYPSAAQRIVAIPNGSDDEPVPGAIPSSRFSIRFAGSIYLDRDPRLVFRAAGKVVRRLGLTPADFGFEFIGPVDDYGGTSVRAMASEEGLDGFVEVGGTRSRAAAMEFLAGGTMLLNLPQGADLCVPAKIFEYVRFDAWLLVLARHASATAEALRGTSADVVEPDDVERIAEVIELRYLQYSKGERPSAVGRDGRFNRGIQAERLLQHLETLTSRH